MNGDGDWGAFYEWSHEAARLTAQPHDRPAPSMRSPCVTWGFALRPRAKDDPVAAPTLAGEAEARAAWIDAVNAVVERLEGGRFRMPYEDAFPRTALRGGSRRSRRAEVGSRYFHILWRGVPGVVEVQSHTEFVTFLLTLSVRHHMRAMVRRMVREGAMALVPFGGEPEYERLADCLDALAKPDAALADDPGAVATLDAARAYVFGGIWRAFAEDWIAEAGPDAARPLLPGDVFAGMRMALVRLDQPARAPEGETRADDLDPAEARRLLKARALVIDRVFRPSPDREFVAHTVERSRSLFISSLGSTLNHSLSQDLSPEAAGEAATGRALVFLDGRPESHQLGRLIERIHTLETFRVAALFDYDALTGLDSTLRRLGQRLDAFSFADAGQNGGADATAELQSIFEALQDLGRPIRGGLSYRISRSTLYVQSFNRRMAELKVVAIPTWQPYDEFTNRRLQRTFDFIAEVGDRRDRFVQRLSLMIERLQWNELNEVQRGARQTLQATDMVAYVGIVLGAGAIGGAAGMASVAELDWLRALMPAFLVEPLAAGEHALTAGEARQQNDALFGSVVGLVLGMAASGLLYLLNRARGGDAD